MKVYEFIQLIIEKEIDPEREIVLSRDGEGNGFSPLSDTSTGAYVSDTAWGGEIRLEQLTDELKTQGYSEEDCVGEDEDSVPALVLWPTN